MREVAEADAKVVDAARSALLETTEADTVGAVLGVDESEDGVLEVRFGTTMPGYPGWAWTVGVAVIDGPESPSVLEVGLMPAEGALTAPEWVPWSDRLADYRAAQLAKGEPGGEPGEGDVPDDEGDVLDDEGDEGDEADEADDLDEEDLLPDEDDDLDDLDFEDLADEDLDVDVEELEAESLAPAEDVPAPGDGADPGPGAGR